MAIITGNNSVANAAGGDGNTVMVTGNNSAAGAGGGDGNTAIVTGDRSDAGECGQREWQRGHGYRGRLACDRLARRREHRDRQRRRLLRCSRGGRADRRARLSLTGVPIGHRDATNLRSTPRLDPTRAVNPPVGIGERRLRRSGAEPRQTTRTGDAAQRGDRCPVAPGGSAVVLYDACALADNEQPGRRGLGVLAVSRAFH